MNMDHYSSYLSITKVLHLPFIDVSFRTFSPFLFIYSSVWIKQTEKTGGSAPKELFQVARGPWTFSTAPGCADGRLKGHLQHGGISDGAGHESASCVGTEKFCSVQNCFWHNLCFLVFNRILRQLD